VEESLFFRNLDGKNLFGNVFSPVEARKTMGIVVCHPIAEERNITRRVLVNLSRALSVKGYPVLLFDYFGEGDSEGDFSEATVESRLLDTLSAKAFLREQARVDRVGLLGLRFGATAAYLAATREPDVACVVMWQPVISGNHFFHEWLRSNMASQMLLYGKVLFSREQLVAELSGGRPLEIDGFVVTRTFYEQLRGLDLTSSAGVLTAIPTLMLELSQSGNPQDKLIQQFAGIAGQKPGFRYATLKRSFDWQNMKRYDPSPMNVYDFSADWLHSFAAASA